MPREKVKVLMLADSISRTVVYPKLENPTGTLIRQKNTYLSQFDQRANKPSENVNNVIRRELRSAEYHTVILGAPSVDITNQDVSEGMMDENVTETIASSLSMVEAVEYAIKSGKTKQVILLEHVPRYDDTGIRPKLAQLANKELVKARDNSEMAQHIMVGQHSGLEWRARSEWSDSPVITPTTETGM